MIEKILQEKRFYFYALTILFIPLLLTFFFLQQKEQNVQLKRQKIESIFRKARKSHPQKEATRLFLEKHTGVDKSYVEKKIESLSFLQAEVEKLTPLVNHPGFKEEDLSKRYDFLTKGKNLLEFFEEQPKTNSLCKETALKQKKPIEIDQKDLVTLLDLIENSDEKKPQLIIRNLSLVKREEKTFTLKMDLLKREFNQ